MSLCVVVHTVEQAELYQGTSGASGLSNVWAFHDGRCLYVEHLENVAQVEQTIAVGLDETGRRVVWTRPDDAWEFIVWLSNTDYLDDGIEPAC